MSLKKGTQECPTTNFVFKDIGIVCPTETFLSFFSAFGAARATRGLSVFSCGRFSAVAKTCPSPNWRTTKWWRTSSTSSTLTDTTCCLRLPQLRRPRLPWDLGPPRLDCLLTVVEPLPRPQRRPPRSPKNSLTWCTSAGAGSRKTDQSSARSISSCSTSALATQ